MSRPGEIGETNQLMTDLVSGQASRNKRSKLRDKMVSKTDNTGENAPQVGALTEKAEFRTMSVIEILTYIKNTATAMTTVTAKQKNISMDVKRGTAFILEASEVALGKLAEYSTSEYLADNETTDMETESNCCTKRKRELSGDSPNAVFERPVTEWRQVVSRKGKTAKLHQTGQTAKDDTQRNSTTGTNRTITTSSQGGMAVLVKPTGNETYTDIVKKLRNKVDLTTQNVTVMGMRKTNDGSCLIKIRHTTTDRRDEFKKALGEAAGDPDTVTDLTTRIEVDILDLECVTTVQEVTEALDKQTGRDGDYRTHEAHEAEKLLDIGRIPIGWVWCQVRRRLTVTRCFKCNDYGHKKADCKGPDRTDCCRKCGETGHYARNCTKQPACYLCTKEDGTCAPHIAGSGNCEAYRTALEKML